MTPRAQSYQAKAQANEQEKREGSLVRRYFTKKYTHPFDTVEWENTDVKIARPNGEAVFEQKNVEKPKFWSDRAIQIVAQKYFRVPPRLGRRESSVKELIGRVADTITEWGRKDGYFNDEEEKETFHSELTHILLYQKAAFNSPVWFNVGVEERPQASACFILSVEDTMPSILEWCTTEGMIFKGGSGAGINLSSLRSSKEPLSKGGIASGPVSFMKGADAIAGMVKSGGGTRRAAKMVVLNIDHPDIKDFIMCKVEAEKMLHSLVEQGFDSSIEGKIFSPYTCIPYQNANNSVRVTDEFMRAVEADGFWQLRAVKTGETMEEVRARELLDMIAESVWQCADPGIQYDTTINAWHTCPKSGRINASNPCSEFMSIDDSACNLASLNLLRFLKADRTFDIEAYKHAVRVMFLAQEIIVGNSSYPTPKITENAKSYRQLGLGFANLGALLMVLGLSYDSDRGRAWGAVLTALMTGEAYYLSGLIASRMGPYDGFAKNREDHIRVIKQHRDALKAETHPARYQIEGVVPADVYKAALHAWNRAVQTAEQYGHRNSQATVIAPTGCLVGNSFIVTDRGLVRLKTLGNPAGERWQNTSFQVLTDEGPQTAKKFFINGKAKTRKIGTESGYQIQGTLQHKIRVVEERTGKFVWKKFGEIQSGDIVPLAMGQFVGELQSVELPPLGDMHWNADYSTKAPRQMTEDLATLVGYFMGDGSLHAKGLRFCVAEEDQDVVEQLKTLVKNLFGIEAKIAKREGYTEVAVHSVPLTFWWEACGFAKKPPVPLHKGKGYHPHIPDAILYTNNSNIYQAFLRGLFEADGTLTGGVPSLSAASEEFLQEVKTLLLALGIPTTTKVDHSFFRFGNYEQFTLRLKNYTYNRKFVEKIGFMGMRKQTSVLLTTGMESRKRDRVYVDANYTRELIPVNSDQRNAVLLSLNRRGAIARHQAEILYERTQDVYLENAMKFFYDKVVSNEDGGEELTYDLSVPANVTYTANGFISHNTISFMMDCETTGIEPELFLVKTKDLVGGGTIKIENRLVGKALQTLGYTNEEIQPIIAHLRQAGTIEGAPGLRDNDLPVFDCAIKATNGIRYLSSMAHIMMMAAVQPFISGSISKTVNVPQEATKDDFFNLYFEGWRLGLKSLALYREGSKAMTIYRSSGEKKKAEPRSESRFDRGSPDAIEDSRQSRSSTSSGLGSATVEMKETVREQARAETTEAKHETTSKIHVLGDEHDEMETEHRAIIKPFKVATTRGRLIVGVDSTGHAKEIYIEAAKVGSAVSGHLKAIGISISKGLRAGVPLKVYVDALSGVSFEPSGFTDDPEEPVASSIISYCMRWMAKRFPLNGEPAEYDWGNVGTFEKMEKAESLATMPEILTKEPQPLLDTIVKDSKREDIKTILASSWNREYTFFCSDCGNFMKPTGTNCFTCTTCGTNTGCG